jgi:hypothetical protein
MANYDGLRRIKTNQCVASSYRLDIFATTQPVVGASLVTFAGHEDSGSAHVAQAGQTSRFAASSRCRGGRRWLSRRSRGRCPRTPFACRRCGRARTLVSVRLQRQVVDYALRRRSLLAEVYSGRTGVSEVCDANPYLLRAAKFHGKPSQVMCPICRKEQLTLVSWVFGEHLGAVSGSARTAEELVMLATRFEEFRVHVVEVCRTCSWNHLVKSYVLGAPRTAPPPRGTRGTRTARNDARTASE